jgi:cytochrome P450
VSREQQYPLGARLTLAELSGDPHAALAQLRASEPVSWVPCLNGWLVTRHDLAIAVMGDAGRFTVDHPGFSTAQVIGPSMLSLDGWEHTQHRAPFVGPFRSGAVSRDLTGAVSRQVSRLIDELAPLGRMELRRQFAGRLSAAVIAHALGLDDDEVEELLDRYDAIVASVTSITSGQGPTAQGRNAFGALRQRLNAVIASEDGRSVLSAAAQAHRSGVLNHDQIAANAAVLLFGGIETAEGMIATAALELLSRPVHLERARQDATTLDAVVDESLRLEPAAAVVDRYAVRECTLDEAEIEQGELVRVSITAANRDPTVFSDPDRFDPSRPNLRRHLAFAQGPHVCVGVHMARLEARLGLGGLMERLPDLRLDPDERPEVRGLVFRKPERLEVLWTAQACDPRSQPPP